MITDAMMMRLVRLEQIVCIHVTSAYICPNESSAKGSTVEPTGTSQQRTEVISDDANAGDVASLGETEIRTDSFLGSGGGC